MTSLELYGLFAPFVLCGLLWAWTRWLIND